MTPRQVVTLVAVFVCSVLVGAFAVVLAAWAYP